MQKTQYKIAETIASIIAKCEKPPVDLHYSALKATSDAWDSLGLGDWGNIEQWDELPPYDQGILALRLGNVLGFCIDNGRTATSGRISTAGFRGLQFIGIFVFWSLYETILAKLAENTEEEQ